MPRKQDKSTPKSKPKPSFERSSRSPIFSRSHRIPRPIIVEESSDSEIELNPSNPCADMPKATPININDTLDQALENEANGEFSDEIPEEVLAACTPQSARKSVSGTPMRDLSNIRAKLVSDVSILNEQDLY